MFPWNAFPRGPLVCDYIGVIHVLYVNDMNRLSREDLARRSVSRENQFRACPQREHASFSHLGQRSMMGVQLNTEPNSQHARYEGVWNSPLYFSPSSNGMEQPFGISIPVSVTDATPIPSGLFSAGTLKKAVQYQYCTVRYRRSMR